MEFPGQLSAEINTGTSTIARFAPTEDGGRPARRFSRGRLGPPRNALKFKDVGRKREIAAALWILLTRLGVFVLYMFWAPATRADHHGATPHPKYRRPPPADCPHAGGHAGPERARRACLRRAGDRRAAPCTRPVARRPA